MGQRLGSEHSSTLSHCRAINTSPDTVCPSLDAGAAGESHRLSLGRPPPQGVNPQRPGCLAQALWARVRCESMLPECAVLSSHMPIGNIKSDSFLC